MKKLCIAVVLVIGIGFLFLHGCSSTPPGTVSVADILEKESELLGQHVVVIGKAETYTSMDQYDLFYLYKEMDEVWVELPEDAISMPPQAEKIRVEGILKRKQFTTMPDEELYIEATSVSLE